MFCGYTDSKVKTSANNIIATSSKHMILCRFLFIKKLLNGCKTIIINLKKITAVCCLFSTICKPNIYFGGKILKAW